MIVLDVEQGSPEWKQVRHSKIGASDIPTLMLGSDSEKYALYLKKTLREEIPQTSAMKRGSEMEHEARAWWEIQTGKLFAKVTGVHEEFPFLMASLDGYDGKEPLEIKCPLHVPDTCEEAKEYPSYWWQVQAQMCVCDAERATLLVYSPEKQCSLTIYRDEEAIGKLVEAARRFGEYLGGTEYPVPWQDRLDADWFEAAQAWSEARNELAEAEEKEKICREGLIYLAGDVSSRGNGVCVTKFSRRGNVDYTKIEALKGVDLEVYRKAPIISWRVSAS